MTAPGSGETGRDSAAGETMRARTAAFRDDSETLYRLLAPCTDSVFALETQFKGWVIEDVLVHLYMWNQAAGWSLDDLERFERYLGEVLAARSHGRTPQDIEYEWLGEPRGRDLLEAWRRGYLDLAARFESVDPETRLEWAGPGMNAATSITARQMETWSHAQEVFDRLGEERTEHDRIRNVVLLGVMTFGWAFANRGLERPPVKPHLRLVAPSGQVWTWNEPGSRDRIDGTAVDFARVVTQVRALEDTDLQVKGASASAWMAIAQCFAGPPKDPPEPGTRFRLSAAEAESAG